MKIGTISLGCDKNRVDTEKMLSRLVAAGHTLVGSEEEADVIIVNTCAFIDETKSESIEEILNAVGYKKKSRGKKKVVVTGCLTERYIDELEKEFPEVDAFLGVADYDSAADTVKKISEGDKIVSVASGDKFYGGRVLTTPYHYAYLKIADGCDNRCTYCAIPSIRGAYRSEKLEDLISEAKFLADDGVRELILVAQDVTRYGTDFDGKPHLIELISALLALGFDWIRLLYLEPEALTDELIDYIATTPNVVKYADIPLQHISSSVLKRMNRHTTEESTRALIDKVRSKGITVRSSFICGFPGETEADFDKLKEYIAEGKIDYAGFFAYSREENTPADRLDGHLDDAVKESRAEELRKLQSDVMAKRNESLIGKRFKVIYDDIDYEKQLFKGRTERQTPDVDNVVFFTAENEVHIGDFYEIEITGVDGVDLKGKVIK